MIRPWLHRRAVAPAEAPAPASTPTHADAAGSDEQPRRPWYLLWTAVLVTGLAAGVGVDVADSVVLGLALSALLLVVDAARARSEPPPDREPTVRRDGARHELASLSWTMIGRDGRVGERVLRHVVALATTRLARSGLRLDDPADADAVRDLLGARACRTLSVRGGLLPSVADIEHVVSRLERLDPAGTPPAPAARLTAWRATR